MPAAISRPVSDDGPAACPSATPKKRHASLECREHQRTRNRSRAGKPAAPSASDSDSANVSTPNGGNSPLRRSMRRAPRWRLGSLGLRRPLRQQHHANRPAHQQARRKGKWLRYPDRRRHRVRVHLGGGSRRQSGRSHQPPHAPNRGPLAGRRVSVAGRTLGRLRIDLGPRRFRQGVTHRTAALSLRPNSSDRRGWLMGCRGRLAAYGSRSTWIARGVSGSNVEVRLSGGSAADAAGSDNAARASCCASSVRACVFRMNIRTFPVESAFPRPGSHEGDRVMSVLRVVRRRVPDLARAA